MSSSQNLQNYKEEILRTNPSSSVVFLPDENDEAVSAWSVHMPWAFD